MIRRHTADEATDQSTMGGAKTVIAILIIGAVVLWMAPALLLGGGAGGATYACNDDGSVTVAKTVTAGSGSTTTAETIPAGKTTIEHRLACAEGTIAGSVLMLVDIFKYVLLVAAIASVAVLRVSGAPAPTVKRPPGRGVGI